MSFSDVRERNGIWIIYKTHQAPFNICTVHVNFIFSIKLSRIDISEYTDCEKIRNRQTNRWRESEREMVYI